MQASIHEQISSAFGNWQRERAVLETITSRPHCTLQDFMAAVAKSISALDHLKATITLAREVNISAPAGPEAERYLQIIREIDAQIR